VQFLLTSKVTLEGGNSIFFYNGPVRLLFLFDKEYHLSQFFHLFCPVKVSREFAFLSKNKKLFAYSCCRYIVC
jgi:hypothetical protein